MCVKFAEIFQHFISLQFIFQYESLANFLHTKEAIGTRSKLIKLNQVGQLKTDTKF